MFDATDCPAFAQFLFAAGAVVLVWFLGMHWIDSGDDRDAR